ncbi:hypothetical protein Y032_0468g1998, partial [Ancylostoma ceylanicum]
LRDAELLLAWICSSSIHGLCLVELTHVTIIIRHRLTLSQPLPASGMRRMTHVYKPIKASDLRENLEILQANGGRSPRTSELIQDQSDVMTVTAREPAVHPGPPQKEMSTGSRGSLGSRDSFSEVGKNETNTEKDKKSSEKDAAVNEAVAERRKRTKKSTNASNTKTTENVKKEETVPLMSPKRPSKSSTNEGNLPYKGLKSRKSSGKKMFSIWPFKKRKQ